MIRASRPSALREPPAPATVQGRAACLMANGQTWWAALAVLAQGLARNGGERLARADRAAMAALPAWRNQSGVATARAVSALAEPAFTGPVLAAAAMIAARRRGWRAAVLPALAVPAGVAARWLLSEIIARPRPPAAIWLAEPEGYSLPSRHTTIAALTAGAVAAAAGTKGLRRRAIPVLAAAGVGASRVYLGVHWPSDVLAGWLFAAAWLGLAERAVADAAPASYASRKAAGPSRRGPA